MRIVNIHEARTQLSKLVEFAAKGEPFIIAKAGRPMVKVVPLDQAESLEMIKQGFIKDSLHVPDELDETGSEAVSELFNALQRQLSLKSYLWKSVSYPIPYMYGVDPTFVSPVVI